MQKAYNIHNILTIVTNVQLRLLPKYFEIPFSKLNDPTLVLNVKPAKKTKVEITNLMGNQTKVVVKSKMYKYLRKVKYRIRAFLESIVEVKLLQKGLNLVHANGLSRSGKSFLIFAPAEMGKTYTTLSLVLKHNYNFLGDDKILTNGLIAFCYPKTMSLHPCHTKEIGIKLPSSTYWQMRLNNLIRRIPVIMRVTDEFKLDIKQIVVNQPAEQKSTVKAIYMLCDGMSQSIRTLSETEAFRKMYTAGRMHLSPLTQTDLLYHCFDNPHIPLEKYVQVEERIYRKLSEKPCFVVQAPNKQFSSIIARHFEENVL